MADVTGDNVQGMGASVDRTPARMPDTPVQHPDSFMGPTLGREGAMTAEGGQHTYVRPKGAA